MVALPVVDTYHHDVAKSTPFYRNETMPHIKMKYDMGIIYVQ